MTPNFANVFNDLRTNIFSILQDKKVLAKWTELSFKVDGMLRSNYWAHWKILMNSKAPVPNLPIEEKGSKDGMILTSVKMGTKGYLTELVEEILEYLGYEIGKIDGNFTANDVDMLKNFQSKIKDKYPNIVTDGVCGRKGYFYLINEIEDSEIRKRYEFKLNVYGSPIK